MKAQEHWFISVGELSGDVIASELVHALKAQNSQLQFSGITGPSLEHEGVHSIASMNELNVMGLTEVLKKLHKIHQLKNSILNYIDRNHIKVAILVDFAGFHLKLAEELKMRGVYLIQYIAPKLWAWGEHRVSKLKSNVDLLLAAFPFEEAYFQERGVNCHYIGCPIVQRTDSINTTKQDLGFSEDRILFALLPGSRMQELSRLLKPMLSIAKKIKQLVPNAEFIIPIASSLRDEKSKAWILSHAETSFHFVERNSLEVMAASDAALVASGTATLECALVNTPLAVIYSMNPFTYYLAKKKVKIPWASLVNILSSQTVVQEFLQHFDEMDVAKEMAALVQNSEKRQIMLSQFSNLKKQLSSSVTSNAVTEIHKALQMKSYA